MEGFSDDVDADPTFQTGIDQTIEEDEDEDHEDDDQAPPPPLNAAAPQVPPSSLTRMLNGTNFQTLILFQEPPLPPIRTTKGC